MNIPSARLQVAIEGSTAIVKISGRANFDSSVPFKTLVSELSQKTCQSYLLDLTECVLMDSTFLGVLSGIGVKFSTAQPPITIELLNPNVRVSELLENLGVAHLFRMSRSDPPPEVRLQNVNVDVPPTHAELSQTSLDAHRTLMRINPANVPKFKDVAQFLEEDLKKLKSEGNG